MLFDMGFSNIFLAIAYSGIGDKSKNKQTGLHQTATLLLHYTAA